MIGLTREVLRVHTWIEEDNASMPRVGDGDLGWKPDDSQYHLIMVTAIVPIHGDFQSSTLKAIIARCEGKLL